MSEEMNLKQARLVYRTFRNALDGNDWKYRVDDENLKIECGAQGDDLPMEIGIHMDVERQLLMILSRLPFVIAEDKRIELAVAVNAVNNIMVDGCFDFDINAGHMFFRVTNSFLDSVMSEDVCLELLYKACQTIDEYNDKFLLISKGMLSIEQFLQSVNN